MQQSRRRFATGTLAVLAGAVGLGACRGDRDAPLASADAAAPDGSPDGSNPGTSASGAAPAADDGAGPDGAGSGPTVTADRAVHAANRLTFGLTPEVLADIRAAGVSVWVDEQLHPDRYADPPALRSALDALPTLRLAPEELAALLADDGGTRPGVVASETVAATVARQRWSGAQLYEVMVEFWTNHFAMNLFSGPLRLLKPIDDRDVIRPHALGRFADLLTASAQSPAMLVSLDNARSRVGAINENYGRELLELHTVGVDGGYTEADVVAAANTLTGFTVARGTGRFEYVAARHDPTPQQVMDWRTPPGTDGYAAGLSLLDHLAHHRATAEHLATKLVRRFVADEPDPALVTSLADVYLANDTAIDAVLRALVADERFFTGAAPKFRRPHELLLAALRGLDARIDPGGGGGGGGGGGRRGGGGLVTAMRSLGQLPMSWPSPDGFPDLAAAWRNPGALLNRWNALADLVGGALDPATIDLDTLLGGSRPTAGTALDALAQRLLGAPLPADERALVLGGAGLAADAPLPSDPTVRATLTALLLATPRFQYR